MPTEDAGYERRIFTAARELYDETRELASMNQIAARAKVGKGTVYRTFPSRDELLSAIAVDQLREVHALASAILEGGDPPDVALARFVHEMLSYNGRNGLYLQVFGPRLSPAVRIEMGRTREPIRALLGGARAVGAVRDDVTEDDLYLQLGGSATYLNSDAMRGGPAEFARAEVLVRHALGITAAVG